MKFVFHYSVENFSNTYIIGPDSGGDAILVDPCVLDVPLLETIEDNRFNIRWVLITRCQPHHVRGLRTLKKVYDPELYSRQSNVLEFPCKTVKGGAHLKLGTFEVDVLGFPEYSHDAAVFKLGNWVFCGDILSAGLPGKTSNPYTKANLKQALTKRFFNWHGDLLLFPGEGPPSIMRSEKLFNTAARDSEDPIPIDPELSGNPPARGL